MSQALERERLEVFAYQVNALLVLVCPNQGDNVVMPLQMVHDLHLPPHIIHILSRPAQETPLSDFSPKVYVMYTGPCTPGMNGSSVVCRAKK